MKPTAELIQNLEPLVKGEILAPADIEQKLAKRFRLLGTQGLVGMALAAIDMALWDALARVHGVSLVRLLGGLGKPVRAYGAVGYDGAKDCAAVAEGWARRGFTGIKAKIGYPTVQEDVAVVRAMRKVTDDGMSIMVDYNQSLAVAETVERLRILDDEGLTWWGTLDMQQAMAAQACDNVMPDVMKIGGVTAWLRAATLAQVHGIRMSNHLWPELSARLLCCTPTAHWLEYADWWNPVLAEPLRIEGGMAVVGDSIGSGIDWNEDAVHRLAA